MNSKYENEGKTFLRKESCPHCGSVDNVSVYYNNDNDWETKYCHTPGCGYKVTDADNRRGTTQVELIDFPGMRYRKLRGITEDTQKLYASGILSDKSYAFSYGLNPAGTKLVGMKIRRPKEYGGEQFCKGKVDKTLLYGQHTVNKSRKWLIITEGEFDAMSAYQMTGYGAVSIPTGASGAKNAIKYNLEWIESFERVFICFDEDEPGIAASEEVMEIISPGKAYYVKLDKHKDANEYLVNGDVEAFKQAIMTAKCNEPEHLLTGNALAEALFKYIEQDDGGLPLGFPEIDKYFALRPGEVTTIIGETACGKSTFTRQIVANLIKLGKRVIVFSNEESALEYAKRIACMAIGITYEDKYQLYEFRNEIYELASRIVVYDGHDYDVETVKAMVEYGYRGKDCDVVVFDNLTGAYAGNTSIKEDLASFYAMLKGLNNVYYRHSIVVSHVRRNDKRKEGECPSMFDSYGSSHVEKLSDNVLSLALDGNVLYGECQKRRYNGRLFQFSLVYDISRQAYKSNTEHFRCDTLKTHKEDTAYERQEIPQSKDRTIRFSDGEDGSRVDTESPPNTQPSTTSNIRNKVNEKVQPRLFDTMPSRRSLHRSEGDARQTDYRKSTGVERRGEEQTHIVCRRPYKTVCEALQVEYRAVGSQERYYDL